MIDKLTIHNFQSHINTTLELSPRVNVIVGDSDSGKSAIVRALKWVIFNRPLGDSFVSKKGKGKTNVTLETEGKTISRVKTNGENVYRLGKKEFTSLGSDVPKEIKDLLRMDEINFLEQLSSPFFLSLSSGEASKYLNSIIDLSVIDDSFANVNAKIRKCNNDLTAKENELQQFIKELEEIKFIKIARKLLEGIEDKRKELKNKSEIYNKADGLLADWQNIQEKLSKRCIIRENDLLALERKNQKIVEKKEELSVISEEFCKYKQKLAELEMSASCLKKDEGELKRITPNICPLCGGKLK